MKDVLMAITSLWLWYKGKCFECGAKIEKVQEPSCCTSSQIGCPMSTVPCTGPYGASLFGRELAKTKHQMSHLDDQRHDVWPCSLITQTHTIYSFMKHSPETDVIFPVGKRGEKVRSTWEGHSVLHSKHLLMMIQFTVFINTSINIERFSHNQDNFSRTYIMKDISQALQKTMILPCRLLLFCANGQILFKIPPPSFYKRLCLLYCKRANEGILITCSELKGWTRWLRGFGCCNFVKLINGNICFLSVWSRKYFLSFFSYQNYLKEEGWARELSPWCHSYNITSTSII